MKKIVLFIIVAIECVVGGLFLFQVYSQRFTNRKVLGAQHVSIINKANLVFPDTSSLKYYYENLPGTNQSDKPDWLDEPVLYTHNSDGLNDRSEYTLEKSPQTFRIVALGDSFTYGMYVKTEESWPELLEDKLNSQKLSCEFDKFEVINMGVIAYDATYVAELYKQKGQKYNPDMIVWFESGTGHYRVNEEMLPVIEECSKQYSTRSGELYQKVDKHLSCFNVGQDYVMKKYPTEELSQYLLTIYSNFFGYADVHSVEFYGFESLQNNRVLSLLREKFPTGNYHFQIPDLNPKYIFPDGHPNKKGQIEIANNIYKDLTATKLSSCFTN